MYTESQLVSSGSHIRLPWRWSVQRARIGQLTRKEFEVFRLIGEGYDNRDIARLVGVTDRMIKLHVTRILRKLGVESRLQIGLIAAEHEFHEHAFAERGT